MYIEGNDDEYMKICNIHKHENILENKNTISTDT